MSAPDTAMPQPTRVTLIGLLVATGVAMAGAMGPLVSGVKITIGVETQVGTASGLPDAWMLPATLEGVGAVALVFFLSRRPTAEGGIARTRKHSARTRRCVPPVRRPRPGAV
jgi:hypothetical protein